VALLLLSPSVAPIPAAQDLHQQHNEGHNVIKMCITTYTATGCLQIWQNEIPWVFQVLQTV